MSRLRTLAVVLAVAVLGVHVTVRAQDTWGGSSGGGGGLPLSGGTLTGQLLLDATSTLCSQTIPLAYAGDSDTGHVRSAANTMVACVNATTGTTLSTTGFTVAKDFIVTESTTLGDTLTDTITINAGAFTIANDTTVALTGGVDGLNIDVNTVSIDAANNRVGFGTAAPAHPVDVTGNLRQTGFHVSTPQAAACAAGVLTLDPTASEVSLDANGAACVVTLAETNAVVGADVTINVVTSPGAGLVTFPGAAGVHVGPTRCTTTGIGQNASYTIHYEDAANDLYIGTACAGPVNLATAEVTGEAAVTNGGTGVGTFTANGLLYGNTTSDLQVTAAGTSGQLPVASAGGVPTFVTMSGDATIVASGAVAVAADAVALTTDTTGNYVASAATSVLTGLTGGSAGSEGAALTLGLDYSQALSGDVGLAANAGVFGASGLVFEGSAADTSETFVVVTNPTADRTITLKDASGTVAFTSDTSADIQSFSATATWTKPTAFTPKTVQVICYGAGGGGGSGRNGTVAAALAGGGGGGGGGGRSERIFQASALAATEAITIGAAGTGGAGVTTDGDGNVGTAGGNASFGTSTSINFLQAFGGGGGGAGDGSSGGGGGGLAAAGTSGAAGTVGVGGLPGTPLTPSGGSGASGSTGGATQLPTAEDGGGGGGGSDNSLDSTIGGFSIFGGAGGGGGGTNDSGSARQPGRGGGHITAALGGAAGSSGASPTAGTAGGAGGMYVGGYGGGGGGSTATADQAGGAGGAGGARGGGGGGGGGNFTDTFSSGAGGNGGAGACDVISYP